MSRLIQLIQHKKYKIKLFYKIFIITLLFLITFSYVFIKNIQSELPPVAVLKDIQLQTPLRIFSSDNKLMAEYGEKRRIPVELNEIPLSLINAVIATEDNRFYEHSGVDYYGLARAAVKLILTGEKSQGGSTITMQVARSFFLTRKKTYSRKINEIFLAFKIEEKLSKEEILSLYLNKIFLGHRSYGVAAAAYTYYGKKLSDLTLSESAMIAGLPKAPSAINPLSNPNAALKRRNLVLSRMLKYNYITKEQYIEAINSPITASRHEVTVELHAPYVTEMVRHALVKRWGEDIYTAGLQVYTTIDSKSQNIANQSVIKSIIKYEQRHGYDGPEDNWGEITQENLNLWPDKLKSLKNYNNLEAAIVVDINNTSQIITVLTENKQFININWDGLSWAQQKKPNSNLLDKKPEVPSDILSLGDVIRIWQNPEDKNYMLSQTPRVEAALVSIDPKTGKLLALTGGFDYNKSKFNRVTQAFRQAGSGLKPFIYSAALEKGYTPASIFNDSPIVINDPEQEALWRPQNSSKQFYGPTSLRTALIKSRNLVSIRLLQAIGIDYAHDFIQRFGFKKNQLPKTLSLALGTASVTPLQLATAYSSFANGGYIIKPNLINKITNGNNEILFELQLQSTDEIMKEDYLTTEEENNFEYFEEQQNNDKPLTQIISPQNAYLINNILMDAIKRGTGRKALALNRNDLAGKTGTSSDNLDAWYCGFNPNMVTITWMGYDTPKSIFEYAATTSLPMWIDYMGQALSGKPEEYLPMPNGLVSVRIDPKTGLLANNKYNTNKNSIFEIFKYGTEPTEVSSANLEQEQEQDQKQDMNILSEKSELSEEYLF